MLFLDKLMLLTCCQITQLLWRQVYFSILQLFQSFVATVTTFWNVLLTSDFKWGYNFQKQSRYSVSTFDTLSLCYLISRLNIGFQCIASHHIVFLHFTQPQKFFVNRAALCVCLTVTHNNGYTVMCEQIWVCSFVMWYLFSICDKLMCGSDVLMRLLDSISLEMLWLSLELWKEERAVLNKEILLKHEVFVVHLKTVIQRWSIQRWCRKISVIFTNLVFL